MKKWGIFIGGLVVSFVFGAVAQSDMSSLFSSNNENIVYSGEAKDYTGSPFVYIEGISDKPRPKNWRDELKIKLFGSMEIPQKEAIKPLPPLEQTNVQNSVKINGVFGKEKEVAFVPHTSDWNFIIQVLNDEDILVQEEIQFIKTADTPTPVRDWAKQNLTLISTHINGQEISLKLQEEQNALRLNFPELETGVHKIRLKYLIQKAGIFRKKTANLTIPLTQMGWTLPTASLNGVILFPTKMKGIKTQFLLGKNHQEIKEAFEVIQDSWGSIFFRSTHLMPAHSIVQLNLDLEFDSFVKKGIWEKITESTSFLIFITSLAVILLYLILNVIEIKITPFSLTKMRKIATKNSFKNFFIRTGEIWIGLLLLWIGTFGTTYIMKTSFNALEIQMLFLIPILFVLIMDYLLLYSHQEILKKLGEKND